LGVAIVAIFSEPSALSIKFLGFAAQTQIFHVYTKRTDEITHIPNLHPNLDLRTPCQAQEIVFHFKSAHLISAPVLKMTDNPGEPNQA
jgi:hypothetical protein